MKSRASKRRSAETIEARIKKVTDEAIKVTREEAASMSDVQLIEFRHMQENGIKNAAKLRAFYSVIMHATKALEAGYILYERESR